MERDATLYEKEYKYQNFNSHAHVERDENDLKFVDTKINFNSHAHVERDAINISELNVKKNFNSHAHVERDVTPSYVAVTSAISTHTLTWSVTAVHLIRHRNRLISTHTLTWSVTLYAFSARLFALYFNSHAHVERDVKRHWTSP